MMMTTMILPKTKMTPIAVGEGEAEQKAESTMGAQILPEMERAASVWGYLRTHTRFIPTATEHKTLNAS